MTTITDTDVQRTISTTRANFGLPELIPHLYRLLAEGKPVTVEHVANTGGWPVELVRTELERQPGTDWDDQGRLVGFGVSLRPTPHAFRFDGQTLYGFCATAVLELPIILGRPGAGESTCPTTGLRIRVELAPDRVIRVNPVGAVVSKVRPTEAVSDVRGEICNLGNFFASAEAATGWLKQYPDGQVVPVTDEFAISRCVMGELRWNAPLQQGA